MEIIGIICEYNPFHNGHRCHIEKIKEMYKESIIIAVISSSFCERGEISIMNKWDKTKIALDNKIDLVIELPFVYSTQSADIFAKGAMKLLNELGATKIVFGSESNNRNVLEEIATIQLNNKDFDEKVKNYLEKGINYPTALSNALKDFKLPIIDTPNDLLAISYIKEIKKNNYPIEPVAIKRTNDYHGTEIKGDIINASLIRQMLKEEENIDLYINYDSDILYENINYFKYLKYKIISDIDFLDKYQTVDEGIEGRIKKYINESHNLEELIKNIKSKRYTYNKVNRMLIHILTSLTKEEAKEEISYIRVLGFNKNGKNHLNDRKKKTTIPIVTGYNNIENNKLLQIEYRATLIYSLLVNDKELIKRELEKPIIK